MAERRASKQLPQSEKKKCPTSKSSTKVVNLRFNIYNNRKVERFCLLADVRVISHTQVIVNLLPQMQHHQGSLQNKDQVSWLLKYRNTEQELSTKFYRLCRKTRSLGGKATTPLTHIPLLVHLPSAVNAESRQSGYHLPKSWL